METKAGWNYSDLGVFYLDENGEPLTGWQVIDQNRYYFHPDRGGAMVTGWLDLGGVGYYFNREGVLHTGWLEQSGKQYYMRPDGTMAVGSLQIAGEDCHFTSTGERFLLVNLENPLPDTYPLKLVELEGFRVSEACAGDLYAMMSACRAAGYRCEMNTAYRDRAYQQVLWDNRYNNYISQGYTQMEAEALTAQYVLPPGHSEHHTGLAVDLAGTEEMYRWLEVHAPEFGFILRYPEDQIQWTGVSYEPWHFRYVGRELALELASLGFTPEEYLYRLTEANRRTG